MSQKTIFSRKKVLNPLSNLNPCFTNLVEVAKFTLRYSHSPLIRTPMVPNKVMADFSISSFSFLTFTINKKIKRKKI